MHDHAQACRLEDRAHDIPGQATAVGLGMSGPDLADQAHFARQGRLRRDQRTAHQQYPTQQAAHARYPHDCAVFSRTPEMPDLDDEIHQQLQTGEGQQPRQQIIQHDAQAALDMPVRPADRPRFEDVEEAKQHKAHTQP